MTTHKEAMKLALEALKTLVDRFDYEQFTSVCELDDAKDAITTLEEALSKQEQGETNWKIIANLEPLLDAKNQSWEKAEKMLIDILATAPQQRTWVGLTEEERDEIYLAVELGANGEELIEAKLKEKNT